MRFNSIFSAFLVSWILIQISLQIISHLPDHHILMIALWFPLTWQQSTRSTRCSLRGWNNSIHGCHSYSLTAQINITPWLTSCNLKWDIICLINRLMFNHTSCSDHLYKINVVSSFSYRSGVLKSSDHLLFICQNIATPIRHSMLRKFSICGLHVRSVVDILRSFNLAAYNVFFSFLELVIRK